MGIAATLWRACMSATLLKMREWAEGWLPKEIYGGVKGRGPDGLHERVMEAIDRANAANEEIAGGKVDIRKCFDTVDPEQAIALWEEWGAPRGVTRILREFYSRQERWVEFRGAVAEEPIKPKRSLLAPPPPCCWRVS